MKTEKQKINSIISVSAVFAIICLLCVIRIIIPNRQYDYDIEGYLSADEEGYEVTICENISLPAGIYNVELEYTPHEDDISAFFYMEDGTVFSGGLLCDGDVLWAGRTKTKCTMTLLEATDALNARMRVPMNTPEFQYGELHIYETNLLWSMILTNVIFLWLFVVGIIVLIKSIRSGKITKTRRNEILALGFISLIASLLFLIGTLPSGPDTGYHLERIESVAYSIRDGVFPIRLEAFYPFGYGYANGIFYCDISLYIPGLLRVLGFSVQAAFNIFGMICVVAGVCTSFYCFKRIFNNSYIAILGTALNNLALYRLFDSVLRGGVGFLVASVFFPVLVYGYYRLFSEDITDRKYKTVWIPISLGYTGIICSHILSLEISAFWTIVIVLMMIPRIFKKKTLLELLKAFGATVTLNLWFVIPFFDYYINEDLRIKNVSARTIQDAGMRYSHYLRNPFEAEIYYESVQPKTPLQLMNSVVVIMTVVFVVMWIAGAWKKFGDVKFMGLAKICSVFSLMSILMSLDIFPWDYLHSLNPLFEKLISTLQFPNRFIGYADVFTSITVCALLWGIWQYKNNIIKYAFAVFIVASLMVYSFYFYEYNALKFNSLRMYDTSMQVGYLSGGEYVIYGMDYENIRPWITAKVSENIVLKNYEKKDLAAYVEVKNYSSDIGYVDVPLLHYRDYKAYSDDKRELECVRSDEYCVRVVIPAEYSGSILIKFVSPWYWRIAEIIGYISWILFAGYLIRNRKEAK